MIDMVVLKLPGNGLGLVAFAGTKRTGIHLDQPHDVRVDGNDEIDDLPEVTVRILEITAVGHRQVEQFANARGIANVIQ